MEIAFVDPAASMGMIDEDDVRAVTGRWQAGHIDAAAPGGGESLREVFQRFLPAVRQIIAKHAGPGGHVVIVAHGGVLASPGSRSSFRISPPSTPWRTCSTTPRPLPGSWWIARWSASIGHPAPPD